MIGGLNGDVLHWEDRLPCAGADRVLLINDALGNVPENKALETMRCGDVPLLADASGFTLQLTAPMPLNIGAWDIRRPDDVRKILAELGVSRIVLRSLIGTGGPAAPVEFLRFLKRLDMR